MNISQKRIDIINKNQQMEKIEENLKHKVSDSIIDKDKSRSIKEMETQINKLKKDYELLLNELPLFASNGDFSENADWILTNERKESLSRNIIQREIQLTNLKNGNIKKQLITYKILETEEEETFILTDGEINPFKKIISFESPLGKTLTQHEEGKTFSGTFFSTKQKKGIYNIKILEKKWIM